MTDKSETVTCTVATYLDTWSGSNYQAGFCRCEVREEVWPDGNVVTRLVRGDAVYLNDEGVSYDVAVLFRIYEDARRALLAHTPKVPQ